MECQMMGQKQRPYFFWNWFFEVKTGDRITDAAARDEYFE